LEKKRQQNIKQTIRRNHGKIALEESSEGTCSAPGCCSSTSPAQAAAYVGYDANELGSVPQASVLGVGCGALGLPFVAIAPFAGVAAMVYAFGQVSMAHFNPAVTIGFLVSGHIKKSQLPVYLGAEIIWALLASLFVLAFIGGEADLGANAPDYSFPLPLIFGVEVLVTALLMAVIFAVVYTKGWFTRKA